MPGVAGRDEPVISSRARPGCTPGDTTQEGLVGRYSDAPGKGGQSRKGLTAVGAEKVFGYAVNGWPVADLGGRCAFGCQQGAVAGIGFAPLVVGAGDVDPVPALPFSGGYRRRAQRLCVLESSEFDESFIELPTSNLRLRVLSVGTGPDLVMLHGVSLAAAIWSPWLGELKRYRAHLVELPGHGLSDPVAYRVGAVRDHTVTLLDGLFDALDLDTASVVGHSLGGMFALWHAAARPGRIATLAARRADRPHREFLEWHLDEV